MASVKEKILHATVNDAFLTTVDLPDEKERKLIQIKFDTVDRQGNVGEEFLQYWNVANLKPLFEDFKAFRDEKLNPGDPNLMNRLDELKGQSCMLKLVTETKTKVFMAERK